VLRHSLDTSGLTEGWSGVAVAALLYTHGSTPVLAFFALAIYLLRWGRTMGRARAYVWLGLALTLPLWFLAGLPLAVRGAGDITWIVVPWNLAAAAVMLVGPWRTLRPVRHDA
jgi:hypothetical protein